MNTVLLACSFFFITHHSFSLEMRYYVFEPPMSIHWRLEDMLNKADDKCIELGYRLAVPTGEKCHEWHSEYSCFIQEFYFECSQ